MQVRGRAARRHLEALAALAARRHLAALAESDWALRERLDQVPVVPLPAVHWMWSVKIRIYAPQTVVKREAAPSLRKTTTRTDSSMRCVVATTAMI